LNNIKYRFFQENKEIIEQMEENKILKDIYTIFDNSESKEDLQKKFGIQG
jgi:hypothetical protein